MASVNMAIIVGNLGRDPESRSFPNGDMVVNFSVATTDRWKDRNTGENKESTTWHNIVCTGGLATIAADYLRKGSQVYVEGSIKTRQYQDQQGQTKYVTEIRANRLQLLDKRPQGQQQDQGYDHAGYGGYDGAYQHPAPRQQPAPQQHQRQQGNNYAAARNGY